MAHALRSGLRNGGLRRGGLHAGLEGGSIFNIASLDLNFAKYKNIGSLVTFTRASSGTFVGSDGVLRTAVTNLLLQSEDFSTSWFNFGTTETVNATTAPNGTNTADEIIEDTTNANHIVVQNFASTSGTVYSFSCYLKAGVRSFAFLDVNATGTLHAVSVNLSTGAVSTAIGSPTGATSIVLPNGWYRVAFSYTSGTTGTVSHEIRISTDGVWANRTYTGNGTGSVFAWGAQLEQSATVGEYIPTTSVINSAPRFDHNPTTGESLGLLVEEARTNSIRNNTMVGAVAGTPGTLPTNWSVATSVSGLSSQIIGTGTESGIAYIDIKWTGTPSANGTIHHHLESNTNTAAVSGQSWTSAVYQRLVGGVIPGTTSLLVVERSVANSFLTSSSTNVTVTDSALINQRLAHSRTLNNALTAYVNSRLDVSVVSGVAVDFTLRIGMPQLEQGAFATSVIPTTTAAATRSADVASITGTAFSSWYQEDEGTWFADFNGTSIASGQFSRIIELNDGTSSNLIRVQQYAANLVRASVSTNGAGQFAADNGSVAVGIRGKVAFGSAFNDAALVTNGASPTVDTAYLTPVGLTQLGIGAPPGGSTSVLNSTIRRITYWPTRLANSTLQSITQ